MINRFMRWWLLRRLPKLVWENSDEPVARFYSPRGLITYQTKRNASGNDGELWLDLHINTALVGSYSSPEAARRVADGHYRNAALRIFGL